MSLCNHDVVKPRKQVVEATTKDMYFERGSTAITFSYVKGARLVNAHDDEGSHVYHFPIESIDDMIMTLRSLKNEISECNYKWSEAHE